MQSNPKILVIEDDKQIKRMLDILLQENGYRALEASTLKEASVVVATNSLDMVILDLGLPDGDGKDFIAQTREFSDVPIIVVSARSMENEIVKSFDLGADDYIVKPFSTGELLARIKSALRRAKKEEAQPIIICGKLKLDLIKRIFLLDEKELKLTPIEFNLLKFFVVNRDKVITHKQLLKEIWGVGYQSETQYLRVFVNQIRKKIEQGDSTYKYIKTEPGVGYRFICG